MLLPETSDSYEDVLNGGLYSQLHVASSTLTVAQYIASVNGNGVFAFFVRTPAPTVNGNMNYPYNLAYIATANAIVATSIKNVNTGQMRSYGTNKISEYTSGLPHGTLSYNSTTMYYLVTDQSTGAGTSRTWQVAYPLYSNVNAAVADAYNALYNVDIPITYIPINSILSGPESAVSGETVEVDVSFPDGYKLKDMTQGSGIMVYNDNGYIETTYDEATNKLIFTMP